MPSRPVTRTASPPGSRPARGAGPGDLLAPGRPPWRLRWRRPTRRALAFTCLALAGVLTARLGTDAAERQRAWGTATEILVVARDVPAGTALTDADLAPASWPRALLPEGALPATTHGRRGGTDGVVGRVAADALVAGEVLVADRLAPEAFAHGGGVGPTGRVVALPLELPAPPLAVGDRVDLLAPRPDGTEDPADLRTAPVAVVAEGAVVVGIDETVLAVAVEGRHVEEVVAALVHTTVVPVDRADR